MFSNSSQLWIPRRHTFSLFWLDLATLIFSALLFMGLNYTGIFSKLDIDMSIFFRLWLLCAFIAVMSVHSSTLTQLGSMIISPLLSLLFVWGFCAALGFHQLFVVALAAHLLWILIGLVSNRLYQKRMPALKLGFLQPPKDALAKQLQHSNIEVLAISTRQPAALRSVDGLVIQTSHNSTEQHHFVEHAQLMKVPVLSESLVSESLTGRVALQTIDEGWVNQSAFQSQYLPIKRFFDVFFTLLALPLLLPLMAIVAVVVLLNSGRPILFWQERVGLDGKPFQLVKFRTMTRDSEKHGPAFAKQGDQRITPVGAFLRKFRLDELPQFWNVLRGEMSIIGPRPEQLAFTVEFEETIPLYSSRHWVRPGITGWAQVTQGYTDSAAQITEKLEYDFYYVKNCSASLDLLIVWKTIQTILTGFGSR